MASNGGDATSPPAETPSSEQATNKPENTPLSKPDPPNSETSPLKKEVAGDLPVESKPPEVNQTETNAADAPIVDGKAEASNAPAISSSGDASLITKEPTNETKTDNVAADIKISPPTSTTPCAANGKQDPALPTAPNTIPKDEKPPVTGEQSQKAPEKDASVTKPPASGSTDVPFWVHEVGNNKTPKVSEQQAATVEASKPDSTASPPAPINTAAPTQDSDKASPLPTAARSSSQTTKAVPPVATVAPMPKAASNKNGSGKDMSSKAPPSGKHGAESRADGEAPPEKKAKVSHPSPAASSKAVSNSGPSSVTPAGGKTPQQILEYMNKTFEQRRRIITKQMPTIPELQQLYPDLFMHKQLLTEFQRITKIDIDQKIQEFCVRFATSVIEMARSKKGAAPVIARWENAQKENRSLKQYWDMMTALCLLPLHFGEDFADMVQEIGEDEEVVTQGKIVPVLVARGNIFKTDEFFLIAENTMVQEFEEFTIALASLYSSYWVFNMVYPESIENTYNYIQRCIVRQKEPGSVPTVCRNFTKALQKWNRENEGK